MRENTYLNNKTMMAVADKLLEFLTKYDYIKVNKILDRVSLKELIGNFVVDRYEKELRDDEVMEALGVVFNAYPTKMIAITDILKKEHNESQA